MGGPRRDRSSARLRFETLADTLSAQGPETMRVESPSRPPTTRRTISSISISEPVGFLAPLLVSPVADNAVAAPAAFVNEPPVDSRTLPPLSTAPVTVAVANTLSIAVPLGARVDRSRPRILAVALGGVGVLALTVLGLFGSARALRGRPTRAALPQTDPTTVSVAAPAAVPSPVPPVAAAAVSEPTPGVSLPIADPRPKNTTSTLTLVVLPRSSVGHRIYVDGRVVGSGPDPLTLKCGRHSIKIGSAGKPRIKDLPCGGELNLPPN